MVSGSGMNEASSSTPSCAYIFSIVQTESNLYIVTERVAPLEWQVKRRSLNEETAKWGLYGISVSAFQSYSMCGF